MTAQDRPDRADRPNRPDRPDRPKSDQLDHLWVRLLALGVFILLVNSWMVSNLSEQLMSSLIVNGVLAVLSMVGTLMSMLNERRAAATNIELQRLFLFFLRTPVLGALYFVFLIAGSLCASVTVISDGSLAGASVSLAADGSREDGSLEQFDESSDAVHFLRFTSPFGRPFSLEVEGYLNYSFDLYPWVGEKIRVSSDLTVSPSALIRLPQRLMVQVQGGRIVVASGGREVAACTTDASHAAMLVGQSMPVFSTFIDKWRYEFVADSIPEQVAARSILSWWDRPTVVRPAVPLVPGMVIEASFFNRKGLLLASETFIVGSDRVQDFVFR